MIPLAVDRVYRRPPYPTLPMPRSRPRDSLDASSRAEAALRSSSCAPVMLVPPPPAPCSIWPTALASGDGGGGGGEGNWDVARPRIARDAAALSIANLPKVPKQHPVSASRPCSRPPSAGWQGLMWREAATHGSEEPVADVVRLSNPAERECRYTVHGPTPMALDFHMPVRRRRPIEVLR
jgi:hypothetical protein